MSENENVDITQNEMENFEIKDEVQNEQEIIDPLNDLVEIEFSDEEDFNIDEYAEVINIMERDSSMLKKEEAEEIIKSSADKFLKSEYLEKLETTFKNVLSFYSKYNTELDIVKNMTEAEKNKVYSIGNFLSKNYSSLVDEMDFSIKLTRKEYVFLSTAIERKITYDGNEVFNIIDLNEKFLQQWKKDFKKLSKQEDEFVVDIDIKNIVMVYHFLQKHTVKGLSDEFYSFASVLQKIAETNKVYNAFNIKKDRANSLFLTWSGAITGDDSLEGQVKPPQQQQPQQ